MTPATSLQALHGFHFQMAAVGIWAIAWLFHHGWRWRENGPHRPFHAAGLAFQGANLGAAGLKWLRVEEVVAGSMPLQMLFNAVLMAAIAGLAHRFHTKHRGLEAIRLHSALMTAFDLAAAVGWAIALA